MAEAQLEIQRVRQVKADMLNLWQRILKEPYSASWSEQERSAMAFMLMGKTLRAFDRYEDRALSRRKHALRGLMQISATLSQPALAHADQLFRPQVARLDVNSVIKAALSQGANVETELPGRTAGPVNVKINVECDESATAVLRLTASPCFRDRARRPRGGGFLLASRCCGCVIDHRSGVLRLRPCTVLLLALPLKAESSSAGRQGVHSA